MRISALILFLIIIFESAYSQEDSISVAAQQKAMDLKTQLAMKNKFGIYGHFNYNMFISDFQQLPGIPCCSPGFNGGAGTGFSIGGIFEKPLNPDLHLNFRVGLTQYSGYFTEEESTVGLVNGVATDVVFEHYLEADLPALTLEPMIAYQYIENLFFHGGLRFGLFMNPQFEQYEQIIKPETRGTFSDGRRINNATSGDLQDALIFQAGINLGISYHLPMDRKSSLFIVPEVFYTFNATPVVSGVTWFSHQLRAGIAVKYRKPLPPPPAPLAPPAQPLDEFPLPNQPPVLAADIDAIEIDSNGVENPNFNIRIEDFVSLNMRPLLNYVFFEEGSGKIPDRYKKLQLREVDDFNLKILRDKNAMETYYHVLNIVGMRMKDNPEEKITLIGTNSDNGVEENNKELSKERAFAVSNYLQRTWGISPDRIEIEARNKPKQPTRDDEAGGDEENRRVEIISKGLGLTEPVITIDTMRVLSPTKVKFIPTMDSDRDISDWRIIAQQNNKVLTEFKGKGNIPESIVWDMTGENATVPTTAGNIFYWIEIEDDLGQKTVSSRKRLPVEQLTIDKKRLESIEDKEFEYYSLILFDFGTSSLGREHREVVDFVKGRISDDATVKIIGYTDSMGDEGINKRISLKRASAVSNRLQIPGAEVEGSGENPLLFDNSLPEGRFYCRTVQITIETPVK